MNLPSGEMLRQAANARQADYKRDFLAQMGAGFSGYAAMAVEGVDGIEEGALFFKNGQLLGSAYEYPKHLVSVSSDEALRCCFNALASDYAVFDLVKLSNQQVDLILALNEPQRLKSAVDKGALPRLFAREFSTSFGEQHLAAFLLQKRFADSKYHILKKLGLHKLVG